MWCLHGCSRPTEIVSVCCMMIMMPESGHFGSRSGFQPLPVSPQVGALGVAPRSSLPPKRLQVRSAFAPMLPAARTLLMSVQVSSCQFMSVHVSTSVFLASVMSSFEDMMADPPPYPSSLSLPSSSLSILSLRAAIPVLASGLASCRVGVFGLFRPAKSMASSSAAAAGDSASAAASDPGVRHTPEEIAQLRSDPD